MIIYFATWMQDRTNGPTLTKVGGEDRLLSYHLISEGMKSGMCEPDAVKKYCTTGEYDTRKSIRRK